MKQWIIRGDILVALLSLITGVISARQAEAMAKKAGQERPKAVLHIILGVLVLLLAVLASFVP